MKRKDCKSFKEVIFGAGRAFDAQGRPASFWMGIIQYKWDTTKQVFHLYTEQVLGTGTATNSRSSQEDVSSCEEVNGFLDYFRELEAHYKKVYGE